MLDLLLFVTVTTGAEEKKNIIMKIYLDDYLEILEFINDEHKDNLKFVAYPVSNTPTHVDRLDVFRYESEAGEHCQVMHEEYGKSYAYLPIQPLISCMAEGFMDSSKLIENDGEVDVLKMLGNYYLKLGKEIINRKEVVMNEKEKEKVEGLQKDFEYAGIVGVKKEDILALVRSTENNPVHEHSLYVDKNGNYVDSDQEYEHRLDLKLICWTDRGEDKIYFNKHDCAIWLKDSEKPVVITNASNDEERTFHDA